MAVPVRPEAIEAAAKASFSPDGDPCVWDECPQRQRQIHCEDMERGIQAFLAAEGIEEERRYDVTVGVVALKEVRLCGPWGRVDGDG